ncbi:MAG: response regulator transcription factor [Rudaea sp.]|uniref:response regulator transcription factor n=1 Tax=unclassified Rudaea TaxID=2627037 RepID=UPI0010F46278|nr:MULTISPECIES: response regulator transcription factor [unclassified Rudaea]MBN8885047.1 response regulator transcription factor [Rudaea sp.]MBR0347868.1 response regulator transcription factor [Rudaea sp.]
MRLLVVEDSLILRENLVLGLRDAGYAVDAAADGEEGLWAASEVDYDLLIVDALLPKRHGFDLIREVRARGRPATILVLTALGAMMDRITALDLGADDYLVKPFDFDELLARVRALVRRRYAQPASTIAVGSLSIDTSTKQVRRDGVDIALRPREYALLEYLARRRGEVVSPRDIEEHLYDDGAELSSNAVEAAVSLLRKAIDRRGEQSLILTRRGLGYMLRAE